VIIDSHVHILPPEMEENRAEYCRRDSMFREFFTVPKARIASAEDLIASMDECGIDASVLLSAGWDTNETCRLTNDYVLESAGPLSETPDTILCRSAQRPRRGGARVGALCGGWGEGIGEMRSDSQGYDLGDRKLMEPIVEVALKAQHGLSDPRL